MRVFVGMLLLAAGGCGTGMARFGSRYERSSPFPRYYPATWWDLEILKTLRSSRAYEPEAYPYYWLDAFLLLDLPVSLTTDTLLLPCDLVLPEFDRHIVIDDEAWAKLDRPREPLARACPACGARLIHRHGSLRHRRPEPIPTEESEALLRSKGWDRCIMCGARRRSEPSDDDKKG